jgi:hypothetical protein
MSADSKKPKPPEGGAVGEFTRYAMSLAGIDRRNTKNRIGAIAGAVLAVLLVGGVVLDLTGVLAIPGMGLVYDVTDWEDPNAERAVERFETKLASSELSPVERRALREKLLGAKRRAGFDSRTPRAKKVAARGRKKRPARVDDGERARLLALFGGDDKQEISVNLKPPDRIEVPDLPDGLSQKAIAKVIEQNNRSISLCISEALRRGKVRDGRMEVSLTITDDGSVSKVEISPALYQNSYIGECAGKRIRTWRFPRFSGDPVTVIFPYIIGTAF